MERQGSYDLNVSLGIPGEVEAFLAAAVGDAASLFPNSLHTIKGLAEAAHRRWIGYAQGNLTLPDGSRLNSRTGTYAESIGISVEYGGEALVSYSVYSEDPKALAIENGAPAWDMHELLASSHKTRVSKDGKRYLIIPFRWGTPGTTAIGAYSGNEMPKPVHTWWLAPTRQASFVTGSRSEKSVQDGSTDVERFSYRWGDRLTVTDVRELGLDPDEGAGKNMVGMVKFKNPDGGHSQHVTFRAMSEGSGGWQHPATKAYRVGGAVYDWLQSQADGLLQDALEADVRRIQGLAG